MNQIKKALTAVFGVLSAYLGVLAVPMYMLVLLNLTDYFTGLAASRYRREPISSYKGMRGIVKKVCMWLLVGVGAAVDWLMMYAAGGTGRVTFLVASLVAVWLICNELISILENIADIGVSLPPFLARLIRDIQSQSETGVDGAPVKK